MSKFSVKSLLQRRMRKAEETRRHPRIFSLAMTNEACNVMRGNRVLHADAARMKELVRGWRIKNMNGTRRQAENGANGAAPPSRRSHRRQKKLPHSSLAMMASYFMISYLISLIIFIDLSSERFSLVVAWNSRFGSMVVLVVSTRLLMSFMCARMRSFSVVKFSTAVTVISPISFRYAR